MPKSTLAAVIVSDLHLTLKQPSCRADVDWMAVQAGYLDQVKTLAREIPVLCCGDVFDKWNTTPELINFALQHLPDQMICVPGQHDLTNHRMDLMYRTGYGVLKEAGKIIDLSNGIPKQERDFVVYGFGWNQEIIPLKERLNEKPHVALIHRYMFLNKKNCYPGAPEEASYGKLEKVLRTYDAVFTGDNHIHWMI